MQQKAIAGFLNRPISFGTFLLKKSTEIVFLFLKLFGLTQKVSNLPAGKQEGQGLLIFLEKATVLFDATRPKPLHFWDAYLNLPYQTIPCFSIEKSEGQKCFNFY
ncbi:MAG: hypothetical protein ACK4IK_06425 [Bacteroidia bacterium]